MAVGVEGTSAVDLEFERLIDARVVDLTLTRFVCSFHSRESIPSLAQWASSANERFF
jgi:hypothetical protein